MNIGLEEMFSGCSNLNKFYWPYEHHDESFSIDENVIDKSYYHLSNWLYGTAENGVFYVKQSFYDEMVELEKTYWGTTDGTVNNYKTHILLLPDKWTIQTY